MVASRSFAADEKPRSAVARLISWSSVGSAQQDQLSPVISPAGSKVAYSESRIRHYEQRAPLLGDTPVFVEIKQRLNDPTGTPTLDLCLGAYRER